MLHKPTQKKLPKKYEHPDKKQNQQLVKASNKPLINPGNPRPSPNDRKNDRHSSVRGRVEKVEQKISNMQGKLSNTQLQTLLIEQIKGIKNQLREIKQHIGIGGAGSGHKNHHYQPEQYQREQEQQEPEENIYAIQQQPKKQQAVQVTAKDPRKREPPQQTYIPASTSRSMNFKLHEKSKQLLDVGKIQPYMKQFKIEASKNLMPLYYGYHKKSSKPVVIKYCPENKSMEPLFNLYEKLWKNIVKAKQICINKVYDLNEPLATYILVLEANKYSLSQILGNRVKTVAEILSSLVRALQFFHECGYLYRNFHPLHVMLTYEHDVVLIDLKNMKRFVDIKGKHMAVVRDTEEIEDQFISNSRARGLKEGRKDDLESLGYLALYILEGSLPWTLQNLVPVRSKLTLKELCGKYQGLLEYMIVVAQMLTEDVPDYNRLIDCLGKI